MPRDEPDRADVTGLAIDRIARFIRAVRCIRDEFEPLGIPPRRIAQLDIVVMESEAELRRLTAARDAGD